MSTAIPRPTGPVQHLPVSDWLADENLAAEQRRRCDSRWQPYFVWPLSLYVKRCKNPATHYRMEVCGNCGWQYADYSCWPCCQVFYDDVALMLAHGHTAQEAEAIQCSTCMEFAVTFTAIPL